MEQILEKRRSGVPLEPWEEEMLMKAMQLGPPDFRRIRKAKKAIGEDPYDDDIEVAQAIPMA